MTNEKNRHFSDSSGSDDIAEVTHEILTLCENGKLSKVEELLKSDAELTKICDGDGYTPLHRASYNDHPEIVKVLLKHGAHVDAKTVDGWTPLHSASKWNNFRVVCILLNSGANVNSETNSGQTPLHIATLNRNGKESIEVLLCHPLVNLSKKNNDKETAKQNAVRNGPYAHMFESDDIIFDPF